MENEYENGFPNFVKKRVGEVLAIVHRAIPTYLIKKVGLTKKSEDRKDKAYFLRFTDLSVVIFT